MYRATQFLGIAEPTERRLTDNSFTASRQAAVRISEKSPVLLSKEEAGSDSVHTDALTEFRGHFRGHVCREVADTSLGCSIATHTRQGTERRHAGEVDDASLLLLDHGTEEYLRRNDSTRKIKAEYFLKLIGFEIKECPRRSNGCT